MHASVLGVLTITKTDRKDCDGRLRDQIAQLWRDVVDKQWSEDHK